MSRIPKPAGIAKSQPSTSKTFTNIVQKPRTVPDKPKPLKPINRNITETTIKKAPKRVDPPINKLKAKEVTKTPVKVTSAKNIRKSIGRKSINAITKKKPAPYDYKARFNILQEKHQKVLSESKEHQLNLNETKKLIEDLEEKLNLLKKNDSNTKLLELLSQIELKNKTKNILENEYKNLQINLESMEKKIYNINDKNKKIIRLNDELKNAGHNLNREINTVELNNFNLISKIGNMNKEISEKNDVIEKYAKNLEEYEIEIKKLKKRREFLMQKYDS